MQVRCCPEGWRSRWQQGTPWRRRLLIYDMETYERVFAPMFFFLKLWATFTFSPGRRCGERVCAGWGGEVG